MENVFVAVQMRERMASVQRSGAQRSKNDAYAQNTVNIAQQDEQVSAEHRFEAQQ
jgi:hypothetical protein